LTPYLERASLSTLPSSLRLNMRIVLRLAYIIGLGRRVIMTGSSLYSREMTIHMSKPSRLMISGRTLSSRLLSHSFSTSALCLSGSILPR